jgi:hypothetical protein
MKIMTLPVVAILSWVVAACGPSVDSPTATIRGYSSARLSQRTAKLPTYTTPTELNVHGSIQKSLQRQFHARGLAYGSSSAGLTVAYLVIYQEPGITKIYRDYFGSGHSADAIVGRARARGEAESGNAEPFQRIEIVIDLIDSRSHELVYRGTASGDVIEGTSGARRAARIDAAVARALAGFFR